MTSSRPNKKRGRTARTCRAPAPVVLRLLTLVLVLTIPAALSGCGTGKQEQKAPPPVPVEVAPVKVAPLRKNPHGRRRPLQPSGDDGHLPDRRQGGESRHPPGESCLAGGGPRQPRRFGAAGAGSDRRGRALQRPPNLRAGPEGQEYRGALRAAAAERRGRGAPGRGQLRRPRPTSNTPASARPSPGLSACAR